MKTIAGIFDNEMGADRGVSELLDVGFVKDDISILMTEHTRKSLFSSTDDEANRTAKGAITGASIGAALGALLVGLTAAGALVTTGGALLVSGPIVAVLSGAGAGGVAGGLAGGLIRAGFAADEANRYEEELKRGKAIIVVHVSDENKVVLARQTLRNSGAIETKAA